MGQSGASHQAAPVGWVRLEGRYAIRWRRGEPVAYVLAAHQLGDQGMAGVLDTVLVSPAGWTDLAEIRLVRQRWLLQQRNCRSAWSEFPPATGALWVGKPLRVSTRRRILERTRENVPGR